MINNSVEMMSQLTKGTPKISFMLLGINHLLTRLLQFGNDWLINTRFMTAPVIGEPVVIKPIIHEQ